MRYLSAVPPEAVGQNPDGTFFDAEGRTIAAPIPAPKKSGPPPLYIAIAAAAALLVWFFPRRK